MGAGPSAVAQARRRTHVLSLLITAAVTACQPTPKPKPHEAHAPEDASPPKNAPRSPHDLAGRPAPPFTVEAADREGTIVVPTSKVTLVMFFGGWSQGSSQCLTAVESLYERLGPKGLDVVAVGMDEEKAHAAEFARGRRAKYPIGWDPWGQRVAVQWAQNPYYPNTVILLDRKGVVRFLHLGGKDGCQAGEPGVVDELEHLLGER